MTKRALSGAIRLPARLTLAFPRPERRLALEPALRSPPKGLPPRLPISSEDDTFTKLATSFTTDCSPKDTACPLHSTRPRSNTTHWRGETHRTGDERARRQDRLTVSLHAPKDTRGPRVPPWSTIEPPKGPARCSYHPPLPKDRPRSREGTLIARRSQGGQPPNETRPNREDSWSFARTRTEVACSSEVLAFSSIPPAEPRKIQ